LGAGGLGAKAAGGLAANGAGGLGAKGFGGGDPPGPENIACGRLLTGAGRSVRSGISMPRGGVGLLLISEVGGATPIIVCFGWSLRSG
jgi:hypothetical protein